MNGMYNNGMGQPMMGGYAYQGMQNPTPKFNNVLTQEQIKQLQQKQQQFSLGLTEEERLRGICNHRSADGNSDTLVFDPVTGTARCVICGHEFKPIDPDMGLDSIRSAADTVVDILQTIKLMYIDLPAEAGAEYFQIIPLIEKIPQLFEFAAKNMAKHEIYNWQYNGKNMGAVSMFQNLQNMFASGVGFNPNMQPQPMMGGAMPNPAFMGGMAPQQPQPMMGGYPAGNAFGYPGAGMAQPNPAFGAAPQGYAPATAGYQFTPTAQQVPPTTPAPVAAPEAPKAPVGDPATVTKNVTV